MKINFSFQGINKNPVTSVPSVTPATDEGLSSNQRKGRPVTSVTKKELKREKVTEVTAPNQMRLPSKAADNGDVTDGTEVTGKNSNPRLFGDNIQALLEKAVILIGKNARPDLQTILNELNQREHSCNINIDKLIASSDSATLEAMTRLIINIEAQPP